MKHKLESRLLGEISITSDKQVIHLYSRKWRRTKELLGESERREWKSWLKTQHSENKDHGIWSHHIKANRWANSVNSVRLYFPGHQNHCRWWLQPWNYLLLGRKVMTNLDSILNNRDITLPTKVHLVKAMVFPVIMYRCQSWPLKKAEWQIIIYHLSHLGSLFYCMH